MKKFLTYLAAFLAGIGVTFCYISCAGLLDTARVIAPSGGVYAVERMIARILTNAPIKQPILSFQADVTATTTPLVITKEKIVYLYMPNGAQSWKADLAPILADKGIKGTGEVEFKLPADDDYRFALEVMLSGKLTAIEGADGKWWVGTDNPGITLSSYDIVKVKFKDKVQPTITVSLEYNGNLGGGISWQPWGYGLSIGGGYLDKAKAEIGWTLKQ